jgi:hypothetical protein
VQYRVSLTTRRAFTYGDVPYLKLALQCLPVLPNLHTATDGLSEVRNPAIPQGVQEKRRDRREASALQKASQMNLCVNIFSQTQKHVELATSTLTGLLIFPAHTLMHNTLQLTGPPPMR